MTNWRTTVQDLIEESPFRPLFFTRYRWIGVLLAFFLSVGLGVAGGWLIAEVGPLPVLALALGALYFFWTLYDVDVAYLAVIGVVTLLPFASMPFKIGFTPTFLDLALGGLFFVWVLPYFLGEEQHFEITPVGVPVLLFTLLAVGAFVAGLSHGALVSYLIRHFAEILLSIAFFYLVVNSVRSRERLARLVRWLIFGATAAAALGIVLYVLPDELTIRILSALGRLGYPAGPGVLRYVRDDPSLMQRAVSTSVDPNVLGSLLYLSIALAVPHLFSEHPVMPRRYLFLSLATMGLCLGLTISRGSMVGMAVAVVALSVLRYRRLLPWMALALVLILLLPWTQEYVRHFVEGLQGQDLSTQMRFGEYKDALILIRRYPFLGVGFAGAPDIDIYIGVANVYLIIAEQMGLVGLAAFLGVVGTVLVRFWLRWRSLAIPARLEPLWYGTHAALIGGLVGGVFDHYFFSLDFHHSVTLFWFIVGLATVATQLVDRAVEPEAPAIPTSL